MSMAHQKMFFYVLILSFFSLNSCIKFTYVFLSSGSQCFSENLPENTLVTGSVQTSQNNVGIRIFQTATILLISKKEEKEIKFSFSTVVNGQYHFCIDNLSGNIADIEIELKTGIYAKDYSGLVSKNEAKPIEIAIKKQEDLLQGIQKQMSFLVSQKESEINRIEDVSYNVMMFSVFTIVFMFILSMLQMSYLKVFFKSKKLI